MPPKNAPEPVSPRHRRMSNDDAAEMRLEYGRRLRSARKAAGWATVSEAAEHAGIARTMLSGLESGRSNPSLVTLDILVNTLGLDPASIFLGPDHRTPKED